MLLFQPIMLLNNIQFTEPQASAFDTSSRTTSSTFEKVGRWMFGSDEVNSNGLPEAICCPCVAYGRTRLRLNEAYDRHYGIYETKEQHQRSPIYPVVSKDCCVFASLCLPCKYVCQQQTSLTIQCMVASSPIYVEMFDDSTTSKATSIETV